MVMDMKKGGVKRLQNLVFGVEIETSLEGSGCESCDFCHVCDDCPVCSDCRDFTSYCERCGETERLDMIDLVQRFYGIEATEKNICEYCDRYRLFTDVICPSCNHCDNCEYYRNPEYCDKDEYDYYLSPEVEKYIENSYYDDSCGMEFVTKVFSNLKEFREFLKNFVDEIGEDNMSPADRCGGHFNISWDYWEDDFPTVFNNSVYFLDLFAYMFNEPKTWRRGGYAEFPANLMETGDKFKAIHEKAYAIEFRFPDSPRDVDNYVLMAATIISLCSIDYDITYNKDERLKTRDIYEKIKEDGKQLNEDEKRYLIEKFKLLIRVIRKPLKQLSEELRIDLIKALHWRFSFPKYEEEKHKMRINLDEFKLNTKVNVEKVDGRQLTLEVFAA